MDGLHSVRAFDGILNCLPLVPILFSWRKSKRHREIWDAETNATQLPANSPQKQLENLMHALKTWLDPIAPTRKPPLGGQPHHPAGKRGLRRKVSYLTHRPYAKQSKEAAPPRANPTDDKAKTPIPKPRPDPLRPQNTSAVVTFKGNPQAQPRSNKRTTSNRRKSLCARILPLSGGQGIRTLNRFPGT